MANGHGGKRPGAGRPPKDVSERRAWNQARVVLDLTPPEELDTVWRSLLSFAKAGKPESAKLALSYLLGAPVQPIEVSGKDGGPIEHKDVGLEPKALRAARAAYLAALDGPGDLGAGQSNDHSPDEGPDRVSPV